MKLTRRQFNRAVAGASGLAAMGPLGRAFADRNDQMNILCWEGYNSDEVLGPFRNANPGATVSMGISIAGSRHCPGRSGTSTKLQVRLP